VVTERTAAQALKPSEAVPRWDEFLGEGPTTNLHPRTGLPDPNRIVSSDGLRSIRFGPHEMGSSPTKFHFHEETWSFDSGSNTWLVDKGPGAGPLPEGGMVMRLDIVRFATGNRLVVEAAGGSVAGVVAWMGEAAPPGAREVDVELEVPDAVDWREIGIGDGAADVPAPADDELRLRGHVEDLDQDGVLTLLAAGSVVLIDTVGKPPLHVVGEEVAMVVRTAEVYPTGV
jgi:hypothetical protein